VEGEESVHLHDSAVENISWEQEQFIIVYSQVVTKENKRRHVDNVLGTRPEMGKNLESTGAKKPNEVRANNNARVQVVTSGDITLATLDHKVDDKDGADEKGERVDKLVDHGVTDVRVLGPDVTLSED
jgi:hypothetical protein